MRVLSACGMQETARGSGLIPVSRRSHGEGNGTLLQYSCLENPMGRGAWWAKRSERVRIWLSDWAQKTFQAKGSKELSPTNTFSGSSNFRKEKNSYHSCFQQTLQAGIQEADWHSGNLPPLALTGHAKISFWMPKRPILAMSGWDFL